MSLSAALLFVYTPIPWTVILCIILYRHDLAQLKHPVKERNSTREWKLVFLDLGIPSRQTTNVSIKGKSGMMHLIHCASEYIADRYPNTTFYGLVITIITCSSMISSLLLAPSFIDSRVGLLMLIGLQFLSAIPLIPGLQRYFGPFPSPPFRYHLKRRRGGSLLRYDDVLKPGRK